MDEARAAELERAGWVREEADGFRAHVGPIWSRPAGESLRYGFVAEPHHANRFGVVHGGMLLTFADETLGVTSFHANGRMRQVTVQLSCQFISSARIGEFVECDAEVLKLTRTMLFLRGLVRVGDRVILSAEGVWKVLEERP